MPIVSCRDPRHTIMNPKLVDHFMAPRNVGALDAPDLSVHVGNPVCGDTVEMDIRVQREPTTIAAVRYRAYGCSASLATASILSEFITGKDAGLLAGLSSEEIGKLIGELAPRERHCREFGIEIVRRIAQDLAQR